MAQMRLKPLNPGELTRLVTFQQLTEPNEDDGFPAETWTDLVDVMARKMDLRGTERLQAGQLSSPFDTQWQTWYRADLDPDLIDVPKLRRIKFAGRIYDIVRAMPIEISGLRQGLEFETLSAGGKT